MYIPIIILVFHHVKETWSLKLEALKSTSASSIVTIQFSDFSERANLVLILRLYRAYCILVLRNENGGGTSIILDLYVLNEQLCRW